MQKDFAKESELTEALLISRQAERKIKSDKAMPTHTEAIQFVIDALTDDKTGVVKDLKEIGAVGHRVVHGGEKFAKSVVITDEVMKAIEECNDLAPLHNPANLIGIECMPGI